MDAPGSFDHALFTSLGYDHVVTLPADRFDLETAFYPYPSAHFKTIVCCDLLETLFRDPMHMMGEVHRVLRPGCHLVLTTRRFTAGQICELLENCGLEVTQV